MSAILRRSALLALGLLLANDVHKPRSAHADCTVDSCTLPSHVRRRARIRQRGPLHARRSPRNESAASSALGGDPISRLFTAGTLELVATVVVRILLLITAWNQFHFYRLLYGTEGAAGLDPSMSPIPAVLPNPSDRAAITARLLGFLALMASLASVPLADASAGLSFLALAYGGSVLAVGLGLGSAFVPTHRRTMALWGVGLGCVALLAALLVGRALYPG